MDLVKKCDFKCQLVNLISPLIITTCIFQGRTLIVLYCGLRNTNTYYNYAWATDKITLKGSFLMSFCMFFMRFDWSKLFGFDYLPPPIPYGKIGRAHV